MPKDQVERIQERLDLAAKSLEPFKDKVHRLRTILAGDPRALIAKGSSDDETEQDVKRAYATNWPDIFVKEIEEGRSNDMLRAIRTLGQQTTYQFPEIEAEHLDFEEANLHAEYFRQRLGSPPFGCDAVVHMRRALYDYLSGGFGWVHIIMRGGKPVIQYCDTIDVKWDQQAPTVADGQWWSVTKYASLANWESIFGKGKFSKFTSLKNAGPDTPVELEYYYDLEGPEGTWMVLFKTGNEDLDRTPVYKGKNPCSWNYGGQIVPFLPAECMFFMELASLRLPIGLAEQMLPSQMALWRAERAIKKIVDNPSFYEYEEGSFEPKELQAFEKGDVGSFLKRNANKPGMEQRPPMVLPDSLVNWRAEHKQVLVAQSGADPYASGAPVEGTSYAAEVNAIKSSAGLMSGTIAKENTDFWLRMLRKYLAKGAMYDEWPLVIRHEDVELTFDESDPVKQYLRPDTKLTIREDSMQFTDQQTRIQLASADLQQAIAVGQFFPNAVKEAYENYLRARGEKNVEKYLAPPEQPMAPAVGTEVAPVAV